jgi:hypothetical protein
MSDADLSAAKRDFFSSRQKQPEQISFPLFFFIIVALARVTKRGLNVTKKGQPGGCSYKNGMMVTKRG